LENDQVITIPNNWQPRKYQIKMWAALERGIKRVIEIAHRRWGKDDVALHWAAVAMTQRAGTYWHMLPEAAQARKAIWDAINPHTGKRRIDEAFPIEIWDIRREHEMFLKSTSLNSTWQVVGSDNFNSLIGSPPIGVVFSEWALANPAAWAYLAPILEENGGWAIFITTSRGKNHAYRMYKMGINDPAWHSELQTVEDTQAISLERVEAARKEYHALYDQEAGDALIQQEYYCDFEAPVIGSIYGKYIAKARKEGRIRNGLYDPELEVFTAWDLGYDDATAIWFWQLAKNEIRLIDYYEAHGQNIDHYVSHMIGYEIIVTKRDDSSGKILKWTKGAKIERAAHREKYRYGKHYAPHDAANKLLAAGGRSIVVQAFELGVKLHVVAATSQQNGIAAARKALEITYIDEERCEEGLEGLIQYQFEWDDKNKIFKSTPLHNWASHPSDAYEIIGQVWRNPVISETEEKPRFLSDLTAKDVFFPEDLGQRREERF
jgi:phage terminase large subunit